jgi:hypothetical protein
MIDISKLTENDKNREVVFESPGRNNEYGRISSWNERFVFVLYNGKWQSQATKPEDLTFCNEVKNICRIDPTKRTI